MRMIAVSACVAFWRRLPSRTTEFMVAPASPRPLAFLRIALAAVLLVQAFALWGSLGELYGSRGIVQWSIGEALVPRGLPRVSWLADGLGALGVGERPCLQGLFSLYVLGLVGLLAGWQTCAMAILAWLTHLTLNTTGNASTYGVDSFAHIALFYCTWMPVGATASLDRCAGRVSGAPSAAARLGLRVLQLHLCVVYLSSGVEKATGEQWWNGEAIWRALMRRDLGQFDFSWLAQVPWLACVLCWGTLVVEIGYAFFIWPRRTRKLWALATIGLHAGIAVAMGLWSFAAVMIVLNTAAFLVPATPAACAPRCSPSPVPELNPA